MSFSKTSASARRPPTHTLTVTVTYTAAQAQIVFDVGTDVERVRRGLRSDLDRFKLPRPPQVHINTPTRDGIEFFYTTTFNSYLFKFVLDMFDLANSEHQELRIYGYGPTRRKTYKLKDTPETRLLKAECLIEEVELEISNTVREPFHELTEPATRQRIPSASESPQAQAPFRRHNRSPSPRRSPNWRDRSASPPPRRRDRENSFSRWDRDSSPRRREDSRSREDSPYPRKASKLKKTDVKNKHSNSALKYKKTEPKPTYFSPNPAGVNSDQEPGCCGPPPLPTPPLPKAATTTENEMETKASIVARLTRGYWDIRSEMRGEARRGVGIEKQSQIRCDKLDSALSLADQVKQMTLLVEGERAALRMAEDLLEDVLRECAEPIVVPALLEVVLRCDIDWEVADSLS